MKNKTVTIAFLLAFLFLSSSTILASAKEAQAEPSSKVLSVTWGTFESVQVAFDSGHRINVFQMKTGNVPWTLWIEIDGVAYIDTGTWTETSDQITITEPTTSLTLVITKGQKTGGFDVVDPPGGGFTWIQFSFWDADSASGSLGGSSLGSMTWGIIFTGLEVAHSHFT